MSVTQIPLPAPVGRDETVVAEQPVTESDPPADPWDRAFEELKAWKAETPWGEADEDGDA